MDADVIDIGNVYYISWSCASDAFSTVYDRKYIDRSYLLFLTSSQPEYPANFSRSERGYTTSQH